MEENIANRLLSRVQPGAWLTLLHVVLHDLAEHLALEGEVLDHARLVALIQTELDEAVLHERLAQQIGQAHGFLTGGVEDLALDGVVTDQLGGELIEQRSAQEDQTVWRSEPSS